MVISDHLFSSTSSESAFLDGSVSLSNISIATNLESSDLITPILSHRLQGMDSDFSSNLFDGYRLIPENHFQPPQVSSTVRNRGDFLTGQNGSGVLSSSVDNAGNSLGTARPITVNSTTTSYTDWVGSTDTNDYYRFTLNNSGTFNLSLTGLTDDADVELRDRNGTSVITSSTNEGSAVERITHQLNAGTYYIRVFPYKYANTNYNLAVSATTTSQPGFSILQGTLRAERFFNFQPGLNYLVSGNGNVDFGQGLRDMLDLSNISSSSVTLNRATSTGGGVLYNPGNGNRLFDSITLSNGNRILFEGIDQIRFQNTTINLSVEPNDPLFNQQWNLHMMGVQNAWRFTTGSSNIMIGVEDSGLGIGSNGLFHPDLRNNTYSYSNNVRDEFIDRGQRAPLSHGTAVQGIIAAQGNNGIGGSGINWNSDVFSIDVLGGDPNDQGLAQATQNMISFASSRGQKLIVNMSLGGGGRDTIFEQLVANNRNNALFVIATGNDDRSSLSYPAWLSQSYDNVISVGASWGTRDVNGNSKTPGTRISYPGWWGSNYGTGLTLMGPSEVITAQASPTFNPNIATFSYDNDFNGTSAATPNVAGVASLVWSVNRNLTAAQIKQILSQTAYDLGTSGYDLVYGSGFVNADAAVRRALAISRSGSSSGSSLNSQYSFNPTPSYSLAAYCNTQGNFITNLDTIQSTQAVAQIIDHHEPIVKETVFKTAFLEAPQSRQLYLEYFEKPLTIQRTNNGFIVAQKNPFESTQIQQSTLENIERSELFQHIGASQQIQQSESLTFLFATRYDELTGVASLRELANLGNLDLLDLLAPGLLVNA